MTFTIRRNQRMTRWHQVDNITDATYDQMPLLRWSLPTATGWQLLDPSIHLAFLAQPMDEFGSFFPAQLTSSIGKYSRNSDSRHFSKKHKETIKIHKTHHASCHHVEPWHSSYSTATATATATRQKSLCAARGHEIISIQEHSSCAACATTLLLRSFFPRK